jgi:hypothetical protein
LSIRQELAWVSVLVSVLALAYLLVLVSVLESVLLVSASV